MTTATHYKIAEVLQRKWPKGCFVMVDGQYGSTGKGLISSAIAEVLITTQQPLPHVVTSNAGPNSGHTSYVNGEKIVLMQLPSFGVTCHKLLEEGERKPLIYMNAGAIIDVDRLNSEIAEHGIRDLDVIVHPNAARVVQEDRDTEKSGLIEAIGSTGKGTGSALAHKIMRDPNAVISSIDNTQNFCIGTVPVGLNRTYVEVSQGFSLGINRGFYPYTTSRECSVSSALSDAGVSPYDCQYVMQVMRTYPIRVGGNSGPGYSDQQELDWGEMGFEPEFTTVTGKQRRLFSWSHQQFRESLQVNKPDALFLNFVNYLPEEKRDKFIRNNVYHPYIQYMGRAPDMLLIGTGPKNSDVEIWTP